VLTGGGLGQLSKVEVPPPLTTASIKTLMSRTTGIGDELASPRLPVYCTTSVHAGFSARSALVSARVQTASDHFSDIRVEQAGGSRTLTPVGLEFAQRLGAFSNLHPIHCHAEKLGATPMSKLLDKAIQAHLVLQAKRERDASCCSTH